MSASKDQQRYSVDEMMDALKQGGGGKRKRRSFQPVIEARRKRRKWLILGVGCIGLLVVAFLTLTTLSRIRISGETFRQSISNRLSDILGCDVQCERIDPSGWHDLSSTTVTFKGRGGTFQRALFTGLSADMAPVSFFQNEWDIVNLRVNSAEVQFGLAVAAPPATAPSSKLDSRFQVGISSEPAFVSVRTATVDNLTVRMPDPRRRGSEVIFEKMNAVMNIGAENFSISASGGLLTGAHLPKLRVKRLEIQYFDGELDVKQAELEFGANTTFHFMGKLKKTPLGFEGSLKMNAQPHIQLDELLSENWRDKLLGRVSLAEATYTFKPGQSDEIAGKINWDRALIVGFPGQKDLDRHFRTSRYDKLEFRVFDADFRVLGDRFLLENIRANRQGELRLMGNVSYSERGDLGGQVELHINTALDETQIPQADGMDQLKLELSGTAKSPKDGLRELLETIPQPPQ